jgi:hypothetical protein
VATGSCGHLRDSGDALVGAPAARVAQALPADALRDEPRAPQRRKQLPLRRVKSQSRSESKAMLSDACRRLHAASVMPPAGSSKARRKQLPLRRVTLKILVL